MSFTTENNLFKYGNCCLFLVIISIALLAQGKDLAGQLTQDQKIKQADETIKKIADKILQEHVTTLKPITSVGIEQINNILKEQITPYSARLDPDSQAYIFMVQAYLAHYSNKPKDAIRWAGSAATKAPENSDMTDTEILLTLYWEDYDRAKRLLEKSHAGLTAETNVARSWQEEMLTQASTAEDESTEQDKNEMPPALGSSGIANNTSPPSKWELLAEKPQQRSSQSSKPASRVKSQKTNFDPESSIGPLVEDAPLDPTYFQRVKKKETASASERGKSSQRYRRAGSRSQTVLNFLVDYIMYEDLGKDFPKLQLQNINGSFFYYEPGKGQVLCVLFWALSSDDNSTRRTSRPYRQVRTRAGNPEGTTEDILYQPAEDVDTNADQFRYFFSQYKLNDQISTSPGRVSFLGVNCNMLFGDISEKISQVFLDNPWPWSNCLYDLDFNRQQLSTIKAGSPIMMIVGAAGKICYMGPVGGVLPHMILERELKKTSSASSATPAVPAPPAMSPPSEKAATSGETVNKMSGELSNNNDNKPPAPETTVTSSESTTNATQTPLPANNEPPQEKTSNHQANQMIQMAHIQRKAFMNNKALEFCDTILERWPDSLEADQAKELIKSILDRHPQLIKQRRTQGKYIGEGVSSP